MAQNFAPAKPLPEQYKLLNNLLALGIQAKLREGNILLGPKEKLTPKIFSVVEKLKPEIVAEIENLEMEIAKSNYTNENFAINPKRYLDSSHDLQEAENSWIECYLLANKLYADSIELLPDSDSLAEIIKVWNGEPQRKPTRPYYYVEDKKLLNPDGKDKNTGDDLELEEKVCWKYQVMLADIDGIDYVVGGEDYEH